MPPRSGCPASSGAILTTRQVGEFVAVGALNGQQPSVADVEEGLAERDVAGVFAGRPATAARTGARRTSAPSAADDPTRRRPRRPDGSRGLPRPVTVPHRDSPDEPRRSRDAASPSRNQVAVPHRGWSSVAVVDRRVRRRRSAPTRGGRPRSSSNRAAVTERMSCLMVRPLPNNVSGLSGVLLA